MGVVFFPSFSFMGVMLFPSFALGNASGGGSAFLVSPSPFSVFFFPPIFLLLLLVFHLFFHISFSLFPFIPHKLFPSLFYSSLLFHLIPFLLLPFTFPHFFHLFPSRFPSLSSFSSAQTPSTFFFLGNCCTVSF